MSAPTNTKTYTLKKPELTKNERIALRKAVALKRAAKHYEKVYDPIIRGLVEKHGAVETDGAMFSVGMKAEYIYPASIQKLEIDLKRKKLETREAGKATKTMKKLVEFTDMKAAEENQKQKLQDKQAAAARALASDDDDIPM